MIIKHITVKNFGSICLYDTVLNSNLNILDTLFTLEISTAIELLLCSKAFSKFEGAGVREETLITAEVLLDGCVYFVELKPNDSGLLKLSATDSNSIIYCATHSSLSVLPLTDVKFMRMHNFFCCTFA